MCVDLVLIRPDENWTPEFGQPDECRLGYAAFRCLADPKYTASGVLRPGD